MKFISKNKSFLISFLLVFAILATSFCFMFFPQTKKVEAENYGTFNENGYYSTDGVVFYAIKVTDVANSKSYYPTYDLSLSSDGKIQFVKYGETVLLKENEKLFISFARQSESTITKPSNKSLENTLIMNDGKPISDSVDFLNVTLSFDGVATTDAVVGSLSSNSSKKFFGYVIDTNKNKEGLVQFSASFEHDNIMKDFGFSFYVFNESTYQREESLDSSNTFLRPNTTVSGNYVIDKQNKGKYYSEYFYNYNNQDLATLAYNPLRYEIVINKTIHSATTEYVFSYDIKTKNIVCTKTASPATSDVYAGEIYWQLADADGNAIDVFSNTINESYKNNKPYIDGNGNIKLYFKDLGIYEISYKAVYYNENGTKAYLESLNNAFVSKDCLTIFGLQATYNDQILKQTELRNENNTVSADITGKLTTPVISGNNATLIVNEVNALTIAATNQPQVEFLFNVSVKETSIYYSQNLTKDSDSTKYVFNKNDKLTYTSKFTNAGYYLAVVKYSYNQYKEWLGSNASVDSTEEFTQYFLFRIKDQTPTINVKDANDNLIMSGKIESNNYVGSFVNGAVSIDKLEENSDFDLPTTIKLEKRAFGSEIEGSWSEVGLTESEDEYVVDENGHYRLTISFGNMSSIKRYFDIDKEGINNVRAYNVTKIEGNQYYKVDESTKMIGNTVFTTSSPFALFYDLKASGANITANYVRYAMENAVYNADANNYVISDSIVADSKININLNNPETAYSQANNIKTVTANEVLTLAGLYIFEVKDEAGNVEYFSIILDNSTPTILQATDNGTNSFNYEIIKSFNNISANTKIYWGKNKLVKLLDGKIALDVGSNSLHRYLSQIFAEDGKFYDSDRFTTSGEKTFAQFKITKVEKTYGETSEVLLGNYDIIEIVNAEGNITNISYTYKVEDESNNKKFHNVTVNTDKTGLGLYYENAGYIVELLTLATKTDKSGSEIVKYLSSVNVDLIKLKWDSLSPTDFEAFVDLANRGLLINYYEPLYNSTNKTYEYPTSPTKTIDVNDLISNFVLDEDGFTYVELNAVAGLTLAGKYEIVRTYTAKNSENSANLAEIVNPDYVTLKLVFYVDRNQTITAPSGSTNKEQIGAHTSIKFFDGNDKEIKAIEFTELFKQSQLANSNPVLRTNKLPIGIYIPISKYGFLNGATFTDNTKEINLDNNGIYAPFKTVVSLKSPEYNGKYVVYYYEYDNKGFWQLSAYEIFSSSGQSQGLTKINNNYSNVLNIKNPLTNGDAYTEGQYVLSINTLPTPNSRDKENDINYLQSFVFKFEVVADEPQFDVTAQYDEALTNIESSKLVLADDGNYYTNADKLLISWEDFENKYLVKIDKSSIKYKFNNAGEQSPSVTSTSFEIDVKTAYFSEARSLTISMSFEVYGAKSDYAKYFPGGKYTVTKTVYLDREAPNGTIESLRQNDKIVGSGTGVNKSLVRYEADRFNIAVTDGIYKYFPFATTAENLKNSIFNYSSNKLFNTYEVYIQKIENLTDVKDSPFNVNASPSNVFNKIDALSGTWKNYKNSDNFDFAFEKGSFYQIVEIDYAGNTSIYVVYIKSDNSQITFEYQYQNGETTKASQSSSIILNNDNISATIDSYEKVVIENITNGNYGYIKFSVNGENYLITPFNAEKKVAYKLTNETKEISFDEIALVSTNVYNVKFINDSEVQYSLTINVVGLNEKLNVAFVKNAIQPIDAGITVLQDTEALYLNESELTIYLKIGDAVVAYKLNPEDAKFKAIQKQEYTNRVTYYITPEENESWSEAVFLIVYQDNFERKSYILNSYIEATFDRYEGSLDITPANKNSTNILVSAKDKIYFNEKLGNSVEISVKSGNSVAFTPYSPQTLPNAGYMSYQLDAEQVVDGNSAFLGGVKVYKIVVKEDVAGFTDAGLDSDTLQAKEYYVTIYNQTPNVVLRNSKGEDITQDLYNKTITHSEDLFVSYATSNEISENYGYASKVMLRLRGDDAGYVEIPSSHTISKPGTYDLKIVNFNSSGELSYLYERTFTIASYDVNFYSVVKYDASDSENPYKVVSPTGTTFNFNNELITYHYIVNTPTFEISVNNGVKAELLESKSEGIYTTYLYQIKSASSDLGSVKFDRTIAITVLNSTSNILDNSFVYYPGNNSDLVGVENINADETFIYFTKAEEFEVITLKWKSYYALTSNKIFYQISRDGGSTWSDKLKSSDEDYTSITISKSGNYQFKFYDLAGNIQTISTSTGIKDVYKINFIKSAIYLINGETPIDNAIYNGDVVASIPSSTLSYYQSKPILVATLDGEPISVSADKSGNYTFTKPGKYEIYFTAIKSGNELKVEKTTFTIINVNDSRWAFSYLNYNNYKIDYIKYNNVDLDISKVINGNEILMSVINGENFDNGMYSFKMSTNEIPSQSFEFSIWLNNSTPDIIISQPEGSTTTGKIDLRLNTENLYELIGDCAIYVNNEKVLELNEEYFSQEGYETNFSKTLSEVGVYYIQVLTSSDKLIYSYKVEIVAPLNTVTIILIVVACVVVIVGVVLFLLLRKKLRIR